MFAATLLGLCTALSVGGAKKVQLTKDGPETLASGMRNEGYVANFAKGTAVRSKTSARTLVKEPAAKKFAAQPVRPKHALVQQPVQTNIVVDKNWCRHLYSYLQDKTGHEKTKVTACEGDTEAACTANYKEVSDGHFQLCKFEGGVCVEDSFVHECTWTFYMEDLVLKHNKLSTHCMSDMLESKRSLDGLLHAVQHVYEQIDYWNQIISTQNVTIRDQLDVQRERWEEYIQTEEQCMADARGNWTLKIPKLTKEIDIMEAIADPDVRSAVNDIRDEGYQEHSAGTTVKNVQNTFDTASMPDSLGSGLVEVDTVEQREAGASSLVEMNDEECAAFMSMVEKFQKEKKLHGMVGRTTADCHSQRDHLKAEFDIAYRDIVDLMNLENQTIFDDRSNCLSEATFNYKYAVEGPNMIDVQIQAAAKLIHQAQQEIGILEPRLHDVEHASERMRTYITRVNATCGLDQGVSEDLRNVQKMIQHLKECPGRNDFTISVPIGTTPVDTPAPTPWYEDPKQTAVNA